MKTIGLFGYIKVERIGIMCAISTGLQRLDAKGATLSDLGDMYESYHNEARKRHDEEETQDKPE